MLGLAIKEIDNKDIIESTEYIQSYIKSNFNLNIKYFQYHYDDALDIPKSNKVFIHMPYTIRLENTHKYLHTLKTYLTNIKHKKIIIHLHNESVEEIDDFINAFNNKFDNLLDKYEIYWEHSVGKNNLYYDIKDIQDLMINIGSNLCLDTCHIYNMGIDISQPKQVIKYFKPIFKMSQVMKFKILLHLNDSEDKLGSYKDRHAYIGKTIWKDYDGYNTLIKLCKYYDIPYILEIPTNKYIRSLNINLSKII